MSKNPCAIKKVYALMDLDDPCRRHSFWCRTNDGVVYFIDTSLCSELPKIGQDASTIACCILQKRWPNETKTDIAQHHAPGGLRDL